MIKTGTDKQQFKIENTEYITENIRKATRKA
jgi:hypothetical protein